MKIADLYAMVGFKTDDASIKNVEASLKGLFAQISQGAAKARAEALEAVSNTRHFDQVVLDTSRAARGAVDDAIVSWDGWNAAQKRSLPFMERLRNVGGKIRETLRGAGKGLDLLKVTIAAYAGSRVIHGFNNFVRSVSDQADHLDELSQKTGVGVEALQEYAYAAKFSGLSVDDVGSAMSTLARNMDKAKRGGKDQVDAFKKARVAYKDAHGKLRPLDDVLGDVADRFAGMEDGPEKAALALRLFRGQGKQLIPFLNEGRAGLEKLKAEFRESGAMISGETASEFAEFNDEVDRLGTQWQGVKLQIVKAILPTLRQVLSAVLAWVRANRKLIATKMIAFLRTLGAVLSTIYKVLAPLVVAVYDFVEAVVVAADKIGILKYALVAAALVIGASWAGALLPFVLLAAVIGGIILLAEDLYRAFTGGDSLIKRALQPAIDWLYDTFGGFFSWYEEKMIALGLMKGKDVTSNKMLGDKRAREMQSGKASLVPADDGGVGGFYKLGATARNQQFVSSRRGFAAQDQFRAFAGGALGVSPSLLPSMSKSATTVNVGGATVTVNAPPGSDSKAIGDEVDKRLREFAAEQARAMVAAVGGTP